MNVSAVVWFVLLLLFLFAEVATVALVSVWFVGGALAALIAALFHAPLWLQILLFFAVSGGLLLLLRPLAKKKFRPRTRTNVDAVIGQTGKVTCAVCNIDGVGQVKLGAMEWSARSSDGSDIPAGATVRVDRIEGVKVFVTPLKQEEV